jgi:antitoxin (DNA-binding transcriptional repressor) of toxin-antitoxin stability system
MKVSVQYAQEHHVDLTTAASQGEEVEIACPGDVSFRLTLVKPAIKAAPRRPRKELWGAWDGLVAAPNQDEWDAIHQEFLEDAGFPEVPGYIPVSANGAVIS